MNDETDVNYSTWTYPPELIAEGEHALANPEPLDLPTPRLRRPNERGPTRAEAARFIARMTAKRARATNTRTIAARRIAVRRAPARRRARRTRRRPARCRSPAGSDAPPVQPPAAPRGGS